MFFFLIYHHHPENIQGAAPQLSPRPHRDLFKHLEALHGPTENHGGGAGASSGGLPSSEETETAAARGQDCGSGKTQEPPVMFSRQRFTSPRAPSAAKFRDTITISRLYALCNSGTEMPAGELSIT